MTLNLQLIVVLEAPESWAISLWRALRPGGRDLIAGVTRSPTIIGGDLGNRTWNYELSRS